MSLELQQNPGSATGPRTAAGKLRSASNSFKHGLYSTKLVLNEPADQESYSIILHNFEEEYAPITPTEALLVQQLAAAHFRHLKVQGLYAMTLNEAFASLSATDVKPEFYENITHDNLLKDSPSFRLYQRELERLPYKIARLIKQLQTLRKLRPSVLAENAADLPTLPILERNLEMKGTNSPSTTPPGSAKIEAVPPGALSTTVSAADS